MINNNKVKIFEFSSYDYNSIYSKVFLFLSDNDIIKSGQTVLIKPNWVKEAHLFKCDDWDYVITHPILIKAVLKAVLELLDGRGKVIITDGPQTDSSFDKIMERMNPEEWIELGKSFGIVVEIIDLREDEWINKGDITISKKKLKGDPQGSVEFNLKNNVSEFYGHKKSMRGYYGADYDISETNKAHDGENNKYKVSKTVINADVFINMPKLKTHKKAGITCCLKNLVGINTYKNYLPHHNEGASDENGDQFPGRSIKNKFEGSLMAFLKKYLLQNQKLAFFFVPLKKIGAFLFGKTEEVVRSGNWYGNDTIWRTILDLNKILLYGSNNGNLLVDNWVNSKKYIGIVDGIYAGQGNGPMAPDKVYLKKIILGTNPVAIDCVCAKIMGFDYKKIPSISKAFEIKKYKLTNFNYNDIKILLDNNEEFSINNLDKKYITFCNPHFGWKNHIEERYE